MVRQLDIDYLLGELTLQEKISLLAGQDFWRTVPIPRLNIPAIRTSDGPNGIRGSRWFNAVPSTCFPCGTALGSTFDKELLVRAGKLMAEEAKLKGVHVILGPTCNIQRSPLGGRGFESFSEDPLLSGLATTAIINGIQDEKVLATIKHFVCNDQEDERTAVDTLVNERGLREIYLKPFQIALLRSDPKALMTAYNKVNGEHVSQSKRLLQDVLRGEWGYKGAIMSDWYGCYSSSEAIKAGLNLEMPGPTSMRQVSVISHKVASNEINIQDIDDNVRYVLEMINECLKIGIPDEKDVIESPNNDPAAHTLIREIGSNSIVLLKNENNILPLKKTEKIAVIGPNAKVAQYCGGGSAALHPNYTVTPYKGIQDKVEYSIPYTIGATNHKQLPDLGAHLFLDEECTKPGFETKVYLESHASEQRNLVDSLVLKSSDWIKLNDYINPKIHSSLYYVDFEGWFTPEQTATYVFGVSVWGTAQLFVNDKLIIDNTKSQVRGDFFYRCGTVEKTANLLLQKNVKYKITVLFGSAPTCELPDYAMDSSKVAGGLTFGYIRHIEPEVELQQAAKIASEVDKVVVVVGLSKEWETEGRDRETMQLPGFTDKLVETVLKANPNTIVVNQSGAPVEMPWAESVPAVVQAWFGGNELGNAIADVLFGDVNPSAKLALTFPRKLEDNPSYLNFGSSKGQVWYGEDIFVGYRYYEKLNRPVLFPFGHGLSYTSFKFDDLKVSKDEENLNVSVKITNTGVIAGSEIVQVYIRQKNPTIRRPLKELKDFEKIALASSEGKVVDLKIRLKEATSYWNVYKNKWTSEKDEYEVLVGNSSDNILLTGSFKTEKEVNWVGL